VNCNLELIISIYSALISSIQVYLKMLEPKGLTRECLSFKTLLEVWFFFSAFRISMALSSYSDSEMADLLSISDIAMRWDGLLLRPGVMVTRVLPEQIRPLLTIVCLMRFYSSCGEGGISRSSTSSGTFASSSSSYLVPKVVGCTLWSWF
jgi:hypothetical protein